VATVAEAAREHQKAAGVLVGTLQQARAYHELGFTFLGCGSDGGLLASTAQHVAGELRGLSRAATVNAGASP
jgi:2-keto-3-deoxy-L-rhamnonate aldolase RhmA